MATSQIQDIMKRLSSQEAASRELFMVQRENLSLHKEIMNFQKDRDEMKMKIGTLEEALRRSAKRTEKLELEMKTYQSQSGSRFDQLHVVHRVLNRALIEGHKHERETIEGVGNLSKGEQPLEDDFTSGSKQGETSTPLGNTQDQSKLIQTNSNIINVKGKNQAAIVGGHLAAFGFWVVTSLIRTFRYTAPFLLDCSKTVAVKLVSLPYSLYEFVTSLTRTFWYTAHFLLDCSNSVVVKLVRLSYFLFEFVMKAFLGYLFFPSSMRYGKYKNHTTWMSMGVYLLPAAITGEEIDLYMRCMMLLIILFKLLEKLLLICVLLLLLFLLKYLYGVFVE